MRRIILLLIALLAASCATRNSYDDEVFYIIQTRDYQLDPEIPPPPPPMFYGRNNFILLNNGEIYYHKKFGYDDALTYPDDYNKQPILNLEFSDFKLIEFNRLNNFLVSEINDTSKNGFNETTAIKSESDTVKNPAFPVIMDYLKEQGFKRYIILKWTDEEAEILSKK